MKRLLIVGAGVSLLGAALIAGPAAGGTTETVYAPKDCTKPKVEPKRITLTCADDGIQLKGLRWNDWGGDKAKGKGKLLVNDCDPNCAEGDIDRFKAKVTLLNVKQYTCGQRTVQMYRRAHLRFPGDAPPNQNSFRSFQLSCD